MGEPRWVLGFDGECPFCREVAARVAWVGEGRIAVRSLQDPEVAGWRKHALGDLAAWTPTLFLIRGKRINAWTGRRLVLRLAWTIGLRRALLLAEQLALLCRREANTRLESSRWRLPSWVQRVVFMLRLLVSGGLRLPVAQLADTGLGSCSNKPMTQE